MNIKPQDVFVLLKLVVLGREPWTYQRLAAELYMSASEINGAVKRSMNSGLCRAPLGSEFGPRPVVPALTEFMIHGLKYAFPPVVGGMTRGVPTGFSAPPLVGLVQESAEPEYVWPWAMGKARGSSFSPLYKSVPEAVEKDERLYAYMALVDVLRVSSARGRDVAALKLKGMLASDG